MAIVPGPVASAQGVFQRGDCNQDSTLDITDPIFLLSYLFLGGAQPTCLDACDPDDTESLEITDAILTLSYLFLGGEPPKSPFPLEDPDPAGDVLTCLNGKDPPFVLLAVPAELVLRGTSSQTLQVLTRDESGQLEDVRLAPSTRYTSRDSGVAAWSAEGRVTAVAPGDTVVEIRHRGVTVEVPVRVVPAPGASLELILESPLNGSVITDAEVTVAGFATDPQAEIRVGGELVDSRGGWFQVRVPVEIGTSILEVVATGAKGSARRQVSVTRAVPGSPEAVGPDGLPIPVVDPPRVSEPDTTAPAVTIQRPSNGERLLFGVVDVIGSLDDPAALVRVNGILATPVGAGYRVRLSLPPGDSTIRAEAVDPFGNASSAEVRVSIADRSPRLTITEPAGGPLSIVGDSPFVVRGTVEPAGTPVDVNGLPARVTGPSWDHELFLDEGIHDVVVTAVLSELPPRRLQAVRAVVVDRSPPSIEIAHPPVGLLRSAAGYPTASERVRFSGRVIEAGVPREVAGSLSLAVQGVPAAIDGETFTVEVPIALGENAVELVATDARGHTFRETYRVVRRADARGLLTATSGDGQVVPAGRLAPAALAVTALNSTGSPDVGLPVTFRVIQGDGYLESGSRVLKRSTGADGRASVRVTAGLQAAAAATVVAAQSALGDRPPVAFVLSTPIEPTRVLLAHSDRVARGAAGAELSRPLVARLVDAAGDPLASEEVSFRVVEGGALVDGATERVVRTDSSGLASVRVGLPVGGDSTSRIEASATGVAPVRFRVEAWAPGVLEETRVSGWVLDGLDHPIAGAEVRIDVAGRVLLGTTDSLGRFRRDAAPAGDVLLKVTASDFSGSPASVAVLVSTVAGRDAYVPFPIRPDGSRPNWPEGDVGSGRLRRQRVSETEGATLVLPALTGARLDIAAGSARFPGGSREGTIVLSAPNANVFAAPLPDGISFAVPLRVEPTDVLFAEPAPLSAPNSGDPPGTKVPLYAYRASAGGFLELPGGIVDETATTVELRGPRGLRRGGVVLLSRPGPSGAVTGTVSGRVRFVAPGSQDVPQRERSAVVGVGVYAHSGELLLEATDLELPAPGRGLPYAFRRRYESRHHFRGSLGWNWEHEYEDRRLYRSPVEGNVVRATGLGQFDEYLLDRETGRFVSPVGVFSRLFVDPEGFLVEREADGTRYRYHPLDAAAVAGRLESIADRKGNRLTFTRGDSGWIELVRDCAGRGVTYRHDEDGRITSIADSTGRTVTFGYDEAGDLYSVTSSAVTGTPTGNDFPQGKTREYSYSSGFSDDRLNHNIVAAIDPREVASTREPWLRVEYDEDPSSPYADRVVSQTVGGTNSSGVAAGGTTTFRYESFDRSIPQVGDAAALEEFLLEPAGLTTVTDAESRVRTVLWSGAGLPLVERVYTEEGSRPRDPTRLHPPEGFVPAIYETRWTWTREGLLESRTSPRGTRVVYRYDESAPIRHAQASLIRMEAHPTPWNVPEGDDLPSPRVTTYRRDPLFGVIVEQTPPRGHDPTFVPPNGGPTSVERYTTRWYLDYQEGDDAAALALEVGLEEADVSEALLHAGVPLGLGDLNGDGAIEARLGQIVLEAPPVVTLPDGTSQESRRTFRYNGLGQLTFVEDESGRVTRYEYHPETDPEGDGSTRSESGLDPTTGGFLARELVDFGTDASPREGARARYAYDARGYLAAVTDANGTPEFRVHNELGQLVERRLSSPLKYRWHRIYDADDRLVQIRTENYTSTDNGTSFLSSDNRWIDVTLERDILGRVVTVTREVSEGEVGPARSIVTRYRYHPAGTLAWAIHPVVGTDETWEYDERNLVVRHARAAGTEDEAVHLFERDEDGNVVRSVDAADSDGDGMPESERTLYDAFGAPRAVVDAAGGMRVLQYDPEGHLVAETDLGAPGGSGGGAGNVLLDRTLHAHDERGRLYETRRGLFGRTTGPELLATTSYLDEAGRPRRVTDPDGHELARTYDNAGRLYREQGSNGTVRTYERDLNGNVVRETTVYLTLDPVYPEGAGDSDYDPEGRYQEVSSIVRSFDALNRLTVLVDPAGGVWRTRYDSRGNRIFVSDAEGTEVNADADPELTSVLPLLSPVQLRSANDHGNRKRYVYDGLSRLVKARHELRTSGKGGGQIDVTDPYDPDGVITETYEWDDNGRLAAWSDDVGNRTEVVRDGAGHVATKTWPDGTFETYEPDRDGDVRGIIDANGSRIEQDFDVLHRLVERRIERAEGVVGTTHQRFAYDGRSRCTFAYDDNDPDDPSDDSVVVRRYDSLGCLLEEAQGGFAVSVERDLAGRIETLRYPDGRIVGTLRDGAGRVRELRDESGVYATYRYFGSGRLLEKRLASGIFLSFLREDDDGVPRVAGYDAAGGITEHVYAASEDEVVQGFEYGLNRSGLRQYERILHTGAGPGGGRGNVWRHDSVYRIARYLPNVFDPRVPPDDPIEKIVFYPDGNHSWRLVLVNFSQRRLTVNPRSAYLTSDADTLTYDAAGSLRGAGKLAFAYDALRRLVEVSQSGAVVGRYGYDAVGCEDPLELHGKGRRAFKDVQLPVKEQPAGRTSFTRWGDIAIEERDATGQLLRQNLYEDGSRPAVILDHTGSGGVRARWLLHDVAGSVTAALDGGGQVVQRIAYGLYGKPKVYNASATVREFSVIGSGLALGGAFYDYELGFHVHGARYFDPQLGRFLTDGSPLLPDVPLELNGYLVPGLPGVVGEIAGDGSPRRRAAYLDPFRVRVSDREPEAGLDRWALHPESP